MGGECRFQTWTFKLRQGVKWHNVPPLNGRELVADDIKYCYEAYAQGGGAVVYLPGNRRHGNAGQIHHPHPFEDAQYDVSAECGGSRGGHLPTRGVGRGRRSQKAHDRHGSLYPERERAQGQSGARPQPGLFRQRVSVHRRVPYPLDPRCGDAPGSLPYRAERYPGAAKPG